MVAGVAVLIHDESTEIPLVTSSPGELQVTPSRTIITPRPRVYRNYNYSCPIGNLSVAMENSLFLRGQSSINDKVECPFSIAMSNYQMVIVISCCIYTGFRVIIPTVCHQNMQLSEEINGGSLW